jgi:hypothetical protein
LSNLRNALEPPTVHPLLCFKGELERRVVTDVDEDVVAAVSGLSELAGDDDDSYDAPEAGWGRIDKNQ